MKNNKKKTSQLPAGMTIPRQISYAYRRMLWEQEQRKKQLELDLKGGRNAIKDREAA